MLPAGKEETAILSSQKIIRRREDKK